MPNYPLSQINLTNESFPNGVTLVIKDAEAHEALAGKVAYAAYDSTNKVIVFYNTADSPTSSDILCYIDARDFIKDGMVDSVVVEDGNLIITFNTDSGKEPISIPLTDIFDPDLYYTKSETDSKLERKANKDGYYSRMIVGGAETLIGDVPQTDTYTFRRTGGGAIGEPVARLTEIQGNTGVVNQLASLQLYSAETSHESGVRVVSVENGEITIEVAEGGALSGRTFLFCWEQIGYYNTVDHQALYMFGFNGTFDASYMRGGNNYFIWFSEADFRNGRIFSIPSANGTMQFQFLQGCPAGTYTLKPKLCDLTLEYGRGYEPATVAEFETRIWRDYGKTLDEYIAYTQGKLINCKALALESTGQNQWDEQWEVGNINENTGQDASASDRIRSKNYSPIIGSATYYAETQGYNMVVIFYDANHNYLSYTTKNNNTFVAPASAAFLRFKMQTTYGTTYKNDICINISDAAINGTYRPYWKEVNNLNLTTLTGINPTTGVRETVFPNGAGGQDGWRSALRVVNGATVAAVAGEIVDFKDLGWVTTGGVPSAAIPNCNLLTNARILTDISEYDNAGAQSVQDMPDKTYRVVSGNTETDRKIVFKDSSYTTKEAMKEHLTGKHLWSPYLEPIIYTDIQYADGTPFVLPKNYNVQNDGTEKITHGEGEDSIAPVMSAIYGLNAVGTIQGMPKDYTSQATLDGLIAKISAITGTTITKTWDAANNKWIFS